MRALARPCKCNDRAKDIRKRAANRAENVTDLQIFICCGTQVKRRLQSTFAEFREGRKNSFNVEGGL